MYKDVLRAIEGVGIFPVISLLLFVVFFLLVLWGTLRAKKETIDTMAAIPLESDGNELIKYKTPNHGNY